MIAFEMAINRIWSVAIWGKSKRTLFNQFVEVEIRNQIMLNWFVKKWCDCIHVNCTLAWMKIGMEVQKRRRRAYSFTHSNLESENNNWKPCAKWKNRAISPQTVEITNNNKHRQSIRFNELFLFLYFNFIFQSFNNIFFFINRFTSLAGFKI